MGAQIIEANPQLKTRPAQEQIEYARSQLERLHPHLFAKPEPARKPARTSPVEAGSLASGNRGTGFEALPSEAKSAFKRQFEQGVFSHMKDEQAAKKFYVEDYNNA